MIEMVETYSMEEGNNEVLLLLAVSASRMGDSEHIRSQPKCQF